MPFRVLLVCTGNVCRSPMAERLLLAGLRERAGQGADAVLVSSAGTRALAGQPMTPATAALVARRGGDSQGHRARQLTRELVEEADLVLALTREHRSAAAQLHPPVLRRVLTLREAGRLAPLVPPDGLPEGLGERWRALALGLPAARGAAPVRSASDDDVVDPYRRSQDVYEQCADQVLPAVTALLDAVAPRRG